MSDNRKVPTKEDMYKWAKSLPDDWVYTPERIVSMSCPVALWCKKFGNWITPAAYSDQVAERYIFTIPSITHTLKEFINTFDSARFDGATSYTKQDILNALDNM